MLVYNNFFYIVNYYGYLYCVYYALRHLKKAKGQIVVISSVSGELGLPLRTGYCASKFAVNGMYAHTLCEKV